MPTLMAVETAKVAAPCPVFGDCGGCSLQDRAYEAQLTLKRLALQDALDGAGAGVTVPRVVPASQPWRYRGRAELSFSARGEALALGFHAAGSYTRVVDLPDCLLLPDAANRVIVSVRELAAATRLPVYQPRTRQGVLRHAIIRASHATGRVLVVLVTTPTDRAPLGALAEALRRRHPEVSGVCWGATDAAGDGVHPERLDLLSGEGALEERVGPFTLRVPPFGFLQASLEQAERIYRAVAEGARGGAAAWDLYCGLGLVSLYLSRTVGRVYAVDVSEEQLAQAREHAAVHGAANIVCRAGPAEDVLADRGFWMATRPDLVVVDPPRAGLHTRALAGILAARPRRLAYISCNPSTLARDAARLAAGYPGYRLASVGAYDMFPQTAHLEALAWFERE